MRSIKVNRNYFLSFLLTLILISNSFSQDTIPPDFCISSEEYRLFNLISDYRKAMNLNEAQLSKSLSFVAKQHAIDLFTNKPDTNTCNFHSWSDKGKWIPCCFEKEVIDKSCMINKPLEITKYPGVGYEMIYWENKSANADKAFEQWRETSASRSLITNFKEWEKFKWTAVGVGIYEGFAIVWFGEEKDSETETLICGTNERVQYKVPENKEEELIVSKESGRFYIIIGSFASIDDAKLQLVKYNNEGFKKAKVVTKDNKFRISLADYATQELAAEAKKELPAKYKDAWILPF
ncbi:MAG: SPOR domain-containing protein [Bacteroidales bacterium]|nr:SPOR domain-containing protein [Bacteroidales bacterium]MCF8405815.1 SPOR domain-containing protein [Bacteroidales bacterium]